MDLIGILKVLTAMESCIVHKVVRPLSEGAKRLGNRVNVSLSGNTGVWVKIFQAVAPYREPES